MKALAVTSKGIEDVASAEIKEVIGAKCKAGEGCVLLDAKDIKELCRLAYLTQSADRILLLLSSFRFDGVKDIPKKLKGLSVPDWVLGRSFALECERVGEHDFTSADVQKGIAKLMKQSIKAELNFKSPGIMFFAYIASDNFYFGIDLSGFPLQKRQYKVYSQPNSLRGTIAYSLVRLSGYKKGEILLDPFVGDGMIAIEAVLYAAGMSANYYNKDKFAFLRYGLVKDKDKFFKSLDKGKADSLKGEVIGYDSMFKYVDYSRKNAKIAGVHDLLKLSRVETGWLDVKLQGKSIDRIATKLPSSIKDSSNKLLNEFFYQADFVLKDKGKISVITHYPEDVRNASQARVFKVESQRKVWSGKQELAILVLHK